MLFKKQDELDVAITKLEKLHEKSANAVGVITNTINQLEEINNNIDDEIGNIIAKISSYTYIESELKSARNGNEALASNFKKLLEV